jgi:hypothetical protein
MFLLISIFLYCIPLTRITLNNMFSFAWVSVVVLEFVCFG